MTVTVRSFDQTMKDLYPVAGSRIKQWVIDLRLEYKWERETCPHITTGEHIDNTGVTCWHTSPTWIEASRHPHCEICNDAADAAADRPDIVVWIEERNARPPICADRDKLSDEVQPDLTHRSHPFFDMVRRR